jgi:hypothetical protein
MTNEEKVKAYDKIKNNERRAYAKVQLKLLKADKAGIKVTDAEIDEFLKLKEKAGR